MENKIYKIYHIPTFLHKDGRIGKIGCTELEAQERVSQQGYTDFELLEKHTDIMIASDRERELQKQYGYPVDRILYWKSMENRKKAVKVLRESGYYDTFGKNPLTKKACVALDIETNTLIKEFSSLAEASEWIGMGRQHIRACCNNKRVTAYGYKWQYKNENATYKVREKISFNPNPSKAVLVSKIDGTFVGEYESLNECSRQLNIHQRCISNVCKGKYPHTKGYVIKYKSTST
jgi:hypothetical protein